jgi:hypothetical protein
MSSPVASHVDANTAFSVGTPRHRTWKVYFAMPFAFGTGFARRAKFGFKYL